MNRDFFHKCFYDRANDKFDSFKRRLQKLKRGFTPVPEVKCRIEVNDGNANDDAQIVDKTGMSIRLMERTALHVCYCDNNVDSKFV